MTDMVVYDCVLYCNQCKSSVLIFRTSSMVPTAVLLHVDYTKSTNNERKRKKEKKHVFGICYNW